MIKKFLPVILAVAVLLLLSASANAAVSFVVKNDEPGYVALDVNGIGTIPRNLTGTQTYTGTSLTVTAPIGGVIVPSIVFYGTNNRANMTIEFISGETMTYWFISEKIGWWDQWLHYGSGEHVYSRWELNLGLELNFQRGVHFNPVKWDDGKYGYIYNTDYDGIGTYLSGGIDATAIRSITVSSENSVTMTVKTFSASAYVDTNKENDGGLLAQIGNAVSMLINIVTGVLSLIALLFWFIWFLITNLPILVCDLEAAMMFMATMQGRNRFDMGRKFIDMNQALASASIFLIKGMIDILGVAIQAIATFVQAGAAFLGAAAQGIGAFLGMIIRFI